jgi:hypothetical protein
VQDRTYSLPSRLIGERVTVRLYADHLEVYYHERLMERLPRLHHKGQAHIDYRHVIRTLVRKPGAFARYRWPRFGCARQSLGKEDGMT